MNLLPALFAAVAAVVALAATSIFLQGGNVGRTVQDLAADEIKDDAEVRFWLRGMEENDDEPRGAHDATKKALAKYKTAIVKEGTPHDSQRMSRYSPRDVPKKSPAEYKKSVVKEGTPPHVSQRVSRYGGHYHDYAVLMVMYHKTGYVLNRFLMKNTIGLEYEAAGRNATEIQLAKTAQGRSVDHVDGKTGKKIAFGQRGNWNNNFVMARRHNGVTGCPTKFQLTRGAIHLQEAPDFYCKDEELAEMMLGMPQQRRGRAKIVHFVRNPFSMVLSNYYYHAAEPTPEKWVHVDDPCEAKYLNGQSLASHVLPTLRERTKIKRQQLDAVVSMCQSLYNNNTGTFYDHLLKLDHWDGLRLATAQMIISSSAANKHMAGGDILRMANNLIKFHNLQTSPSVPEEQREKIHVLALSMDDYIKRPIVVTMQFLNFVLGDDDTGVSKKLRTKMAREQKAALNRADESKHVTQGKHDDKEELRQRLREDSVLGPILSEVELLVDEALRQSKEVVSR